MPLPAGPALTALALCLALCLAPPPRAAAQDTGLETPRFSGTFLQLLDDNLAWTPDRWAELFDDLAAMDLDEVILQWTVINERPFFREPPEPPLGVLGHLLDLARDRGMRLRLGLVHDPSWWAEIKQDPALVRVYLKRLEIAQSGLAHKLAATLGSHPAFGGFYLPQEIDDKTWLGREKQDLLLDHLAAVARACRDYLPGGGHAGVGLSGFSNGFADPDRFTRLWRRILEGADLDILYMQDGVGAGKLDIHEAGVYLEAATGAAWGTGRRISPVVETFRIAPAAPGQDREVFLAAPASMDRVAEQLAAAARSSPAPITAFAVPEYMTPLGVPGAGALGRRYLEYLKGPAGD